MEKIYNNTSEISINELIEYKSQNTHISIVIQKPSSKGLYSFDSYSIDNMIEIKKKIAEIINGLPKEIDEPDKEKKIFTYIYTRLAHLIEYDELAASTVGLGGYEREMSEEYRTNATNLIGLLQGKSMCSGYSEVLRNVLSELAINSIYVIGKGKDNLGNHAWNQVQLDGKWYNVDLTNDQNSIINNSECQYFLKSDSEFKAYEQYDIETEFLHQCNESVQNSDQLLKMHKFTPLTIDSKNIAEADKHHGLTTSIIQNTKKIISKLLDKSKSIIEK